MTCFPTTKITLSLQGMDTYPKTLGLKEFSSTEKTDFWIFFWANYNDLSLPVTPNGGLVREIPPPDHSGLGNILICPDFWMIFFGFESNLFERA